MVVLIDRDSASVKFTAFYGDHERAIVIERSYGKGPCRSLYNTSRQSAIKYTVTISSGRNIHRTKSIEQMLPEEIGGSTNDGYTLLVKQRIAYLKTTERFIIQPPASKEDSSGNPEVTTIEFEEDDTVFVDLHLQRAIEYLQSRKL